MGQLGGLTHGVTGSYNRGLALAHITGQQRRQNVPHVMRLLALSQDKTRLSGARRVDVLSRGISFC
jgi:hypothetical protein